MRQFDVFTNPSERASANVPFVIILQSDLVYQTKTVVVAPLVAVLDYGFGNLRSAQ